MRSCSTCSCSLWEVTPTGRTQMHVSILMTSLGSVFANLASFIEGLSFSSVVTLVANALPKQGYFFTSYVMTKALGGFPMELLRPVAIVLYYAKKLLLVKTARDQRELDRPVPFAYA